MIKKLIYLFCGTLVLTACGNSIEKKANEKLVIAMLRRKHNKKHLRIWTVPCK